MDKCTRRIFAAVKRRNLAQANYNTAASMVRYANDENGGWATPNEDRKLRARRDALATKFRKADEQFKRVVKSCSHTPAGTLLSGGRKKSKRTKRRKR